MSDRGVDSATGDQADVVGDDSYGVRDDEAAIEAERLAHLAATRDPETFAVLDACGIGEGWDVLEIGAGSGSVSAWMAERVGSDGTVLSTDIELRFHAMAAPNTTVRRHDVVTEDLPTAAFDLVHARAVLQHIPEREMVVGKLVDALRPDGWLVLEDSNFAPFAAQPVPEDYQPLHDIICSGSTTQWRDPDFGLALLGGLRDRGFTDLDVTGDVWTMRPGEPGGEWWFLALERAGTRLIEAGMLTAGQVEAAIAAVRRPGFVMMSPLSLAVRGRKPD